MIRVDPSPVLFYFYFFIPSELVRVDPRRSGPTFVPALCHQWFERMYLCAFVALYVWMFLAGANKVKGTRVDV